ncbi:hypothetical protein HPB48_016348 [Haemaphysalis longicornis]|uniref:Receptor ligand binding region domain-containing protein n=1 Tax=Haemaphysalis longicornis TaxID=44386 RepID=A0A9J6H479_HAELO|nr:hypothetical protein HPB48_016348 [Haemaphysalis longicornis]
MIFPPDLVAALISLQELVRPFPPKNVQYLFRRAENFTATLMDIKSRGIYSMIIDVRPENLTAFLRADIEAYNLEDFQYNFVNITAYRMVDSENETVRDILRDMEKFQPFGQNILNRTNVIITEPALMFDAVYAFAHGLNDLQRSATLRPANVSCEDEVSWTEGTSLFNLISMVGEWSTSDGLNITNHNAFHDFGTTNITLRVTTIEGDGHCILFVKWKGCVFRLQGIILVIAGLEITL